MRLIVHPLNLCRPADVRTRAALAARDALLDYFNGVENAHRARQIYSRVRTSYEWSHALQLAFTAAAQGLSEKERNALKLVIKFTP